MFERYYYPKNSHTYMVLNKCRMKNPATGDWIDAVVYTDAVGLYVREEKDFNNRFVHLKELRVKPIGKVF